MYPLEDLILEKSGDDDKPFYGFTSLEIKIATERKLNSIGKCFE